MVLCRIVLGNPLSSGIFQMTAIAVIVVSDEQCDCLFKSILQGEQSHPIERDWLGGFSSATIPDLWVTPFFQ